MQVSLGPLVSKTVLMSISLPVCLSILFYLNLSVRVRRETVQVNGAKSRVARSS